MGGAIAQLYALAYPEELKGIILIGTGSRLKVHPKYLQEALDAQDNSSRWLESCEVKLAKVKSDVRTMFMRKVVDIGPGVQHNDFLCCDKFDVMDKIQQIRLPTQIVCGSEDVMTPCEYSNYLASKIKGAQIAVLEGATHYVQMERPREVNGAIARFLAALG
jgi:pimeloyl-ACP methyl ester carboxylesterase